MLERDDEDLAVEQLPGAGRADDADADRSASTPREPRQEQAAARAQPIPMIASAALLRELGDRIQQLRTQVGALPTRQLQRIEDLDARAITLTSQREQITRRTDDLPQPRRRLGREQDPHSVERANLTGALQAADRELDAVISQRERLARDLGDPSEIRAERDGLQRALTQITREHTEIRDELAEREIHTPGTWATRALGERPDEPQLRTQWEHAVRQAALYHLQYDVTHPNDPLGAEPQPRGQQRDWQRAREAIDRSARRLGRHMASDHDLEIGMGE
jgi:hypothetical protein